MQTANSRKKEALYGILLRNNCTSINLIDYDTSPVQGCACMLSCSVMSNFLPRMDCSPSGFSVHGIFQATELQRVATSYSRGSSQSSNRTQISCVFCTGRRILYHSVSWEACILLQETLNTLKSLKKTVDLTINQSLVFCERAKIYK